MSGFLHQLAARSLGLAPQIKLRSALPYAAPALDSLPLAAINAESPSAERIIGMVPPLSIPDTTSRDALQPNECLPEPLVAINASGLPMNGQSSSPPSPPIVAGENEQPRRQSVEFSTSQNATESSSGISQRSIKAETALRSPDSKTPAAADFIQPTQTISSESDLQNRLPDMATLVARLIGQFAPQTAPQATQQTERPSQPSSKPATLIPRPVASHIRPPASRESQQPAATESAPEIHITIGRLEVNPPARPAPLPPPRPRGPAPLSLSDYLARRHGGRS